MSSTSSNTRETVAEKPRDADYWARRASGLQLAEVPSQALNLNVQGKDTVGPLQGFGPLWQKTYKVRLSGANVTPRDVIKTWKEHFQRFWPKRNYFYGPVSGIVPGEAALLNLDLDGGMPLSTGVLVLYADEESFTFMTPQGHIFASWITFSAYEDEGTTVVQIQALIRTNDLIFELAFRLGGKKEDRFWQHTLTELAAFFGSRDMSRCQPSTSTPSFSGRRPKTSGITQAYVPPSIS